MFFSPLAIDLSSLPQAPIAARRVDIDVEAARATFGKCRTRSNSHFVTLERPGPAVDSLVIERCLASACVRLRVNRLDSKEFILKDRPTVRKIIKIRHTRLQKSSQISFLKKKIKMMLAQYEVERDLTCFKQS